MRFTIAVFNLRYDAVYIYALFNGVNSELVTCPLPWKMTIRFP